MGDDQKIKEIKISELHLWTENPRDPIGEDIGDLEIIKKAIKDDRDKWNIPKLIEEMGDFYHLNKLPIVVFKNKKHIVYDGNKRIVVLKYLQNPQWSVVIEKKLFPSSPPKNLVNLKEISCVLCNEKTALTIIQADNIRNNTWSALQQDYFDHYHLKKEKSLFLKIEEATHLISENYKALDQNFIKTEILTVDNFYKLGFYFDSNNKLESVYPSYEKDEKLQLIFEKLIQLIQSKQISTRKNRGSIKPLIDDKELNIRNFTEQSSKNVIKDNNLQKKLRKTPRDKAIVDTLFGEKLELKKGKVNDLYSILDEIYETFKRDKNILPIIGMSLRLIMEAAGRKYFENEGDKRASDDAVFGEFMKEIKASDMLDQKELNFNSIGTDILKKNSDFESLLAKYAHANIEYDKTNILQCSKIVGKILKHYYGKND